MKATTEDKRERKDSLAGKLAMTGGGAGLAVFAIYGVLNASLIGGIIGLNVAGTLLGFPVESVLVSKALVALGMLGGVLIAGLICITAGATAGWLAGKAAEAAARVISHAHHAPADIRH